VELTKSHEKNNHSLTITPGCWLHGLYPDHTEFTVNSIHHQGIKTLASSFRTEAFCLDDGRIEAIRRIDGSFVAGVQWHPELESPGNASNFDDLPLIASFLREARARRLA
jgi:putative glutamine amidotransferase